MTSQTMETSLNDIKKTLGTSQRNQKHWGHLTMTSQNIGTSQYIIIETLVISPHNYTSRLKVRNETFYNIHVHVCITRTVFIKNTNLIHYSLCSVIWKQETALCQ